MIHNTKTMEKQFKPSFMNKFDRSQKLRVIPLGGVGDVTKNMYVYEYGNDIIIADCGVGFPDEGMPGIDLIIPDISYLRDKKHKIKGIVITHAHDDHIGGLPFIWPELNCPIYAQKLAAGFIRSKFLDHRLPKDKINTITTESVLKLGSFTVSFYRVSHSVPDATGLVIDTPVGRVVHQADFKLDWTPVNGQVPEIGKAAVFAERGVILMLIDALRSEKQGYTLSESTIQPTFEKIEKEAQGKVIITTHSSNITRVQQAINVAVESGRKVALLGRSMDQNFQVARDLGYIHVPPGVLIAPEEIKRYPDEKLLLIVAGAQGQPGSALSRAANNDHRFLTIKPKDTVAFSADPIPSTESAQHALIDRLTKLGANVYYTDLTDDLHVSGHAASEELKVMINIIRPQYLMPIGATFRQMKAFAQMAAQMGWKEDRVLMVDDGQVVEVTQNKVEKDGMVDVKNVYVDGLGVGDVGNIVLRDRMVMAEEGIVMVIVPIDPRTSEVTGEIDIVTRGFVFEKQSEELLNKAKEVVKSILKDHQGGVDWRFIRSHIEENLARFFYEETQRRPLILPVVVEV